MQPETPQEEFLNKHYTILQPNQAFPEIYYILFPLSKNGIAKITMKRIMGMSKRFPWISYMKDDGSIYQRELFYYEPENPSLDKEEYVESIKESPPLLYNLPKGKITVKISNYDVKKIPSPENPNWLPVRVYKFSEPTIATSHVWYRDETASAISKIGSPFGLGTSALTKKFGGKRRKTRKRKTRK